MSYTMSIYDADPARGGDAWPHYDHAPLSVRYWEEARSAAADVLMRETRALHASDGYERGQRIWARVYDRSGLACTLFVTLRNVL